MSLQGCKTANLHFQQFIPYAFRLCSCHIASRKRPHPEFGIFHAACDKTLGVVKAFGHHLGDVLAALFSFIMREASELPQQKHNIRANTKQGMKTHRLQPLTVQILTDCSKIGFPLREINEPTSPDHCKSRGARSRHKIAHPLATFAMRKLLARGLAAASQFALRAHPTRPLRGGRIALVGKPDGFAAGAFRQTESDCSTSGSTSAGSSVRTPFSKLRFFTLFAPIPAPVKLAEPKYALHPSTMMHLK